MLGRVITSSMGLRETTEFAGRSYEVTWHSEGDLPPRNEITQVSAIRFSPDDRVVVVSADGRDWAIPGGHPENGESCEETLRREVREESCCEVDRFCLLGWQHVRDLADNSVHYQLRYCCRVRVRRFRPEHEIRYRSLVSPREFLSVLGYGDSVIAKELISLAVVARRKQWV